MQEDASGYQEFSYGALGEITENIRTFVLPNETGTYTFAMNFEYDSWNRILNMTYPDGEVVNYHYNLGGLLKSMDGFKGNTNYNYIDSIHYNKFEAKTGIYYGNGTYATYDYDTLQRLEHLASYTSGGDTMQEINYTFDGVNNITQIVNGAGTLLNGLGGTYESNYTYDNLYRLKNSIGYWDNGATYGYQLELDYSPDGRILKKTQTASQLLNGNPTSISYENSYTYNNSSQPHTLTHVDDNGNVNQDFEWDANGNLVFHDHEFLGSRKLCWDEENRIMGVADDNFISYYMYDAGGERTYKLTGAFQDMIINGQQYNYNLMNNPTLYTSPYLVATPQGYTKHFYAGSERILSKIGCGGLEKLEDPIEIPTEESKSGGNKAASQPPPDPEPEFTPIQDKIVNSNTMLKRVLECLGKDPEIIWDNLMKLNKLKEIQCEKEEGLYYYHPDHLGSGTWITYTDGEAIQHLHYLPFGEEQIAQRLTSFNSRYTFSAKEKDIETGYSYFGARYYDSNLSIWLSVDPMSDKYPSLTPYNYCNNSPIILVDPNGMEVIVTGDQAEAAFNSLQQGTNLTLERDKNGKLYASGDPLNDNDQMLLDAINSESVTVNIEASAQHSSGHYLGTTYDAGTNTASSTNGVNILGLSSLEKDGATGSGMMHEVTEGYQMGLIAIENKSDISRAAWRPGQATVGSGSMERTFSTQQYENPHDYSLYELGHSRATRAPNEMSRREARNYKSPQEKYTFPIATKAMNILWSKFQGR